MSKLMNKGIRCEDFIQLCRYETSFIDEQENKARDGHGNENLIPINTNEKEDNKR